MSETLKEVFKKLLDPVDEILLQELETMEKGDRCKEFWEMYERIYIIVSKWAKKSGHVIFCYELMWQMCCLGNKSFYKNAEIEQILPLLIAGYKKDGYRSDFLNYTQSYIRDLNVYFVREEPQQFIDQVKEVVAALFPKKKVI
jgi:hypothetical protein